MVPTGGSESVAVWGAGEGGDVAGVALEDGGASVVSEAPEADGVVATGGGESVAVWGAGEGGDDIGVALEDGGAGVILILKTQNKGRQRSAERTG